MRLLRILSECEWWPAECYANAGCSSQCVSQPHANSNFANANSVSPLACSVLRRACGRCKARIAPHCAARLTMVRGVAAQVTASCLLTASGQIKS